MKEAPKASERMTSERKASERMTGNRTAAVTLLVALALAAIRCSVDVPLGVDPRSDAADDHVDAGTGD
jgi:hypothetical protein